MSDHNDKSTISEKELLSMSEDDYRTADQRTFFKNILEKDKEQINDEINKVRDDIKVHDDSGDSVDLAANTEIMQLRLRTVERKTKLLHKIEESLTRIESGMYGYCTETGVKIGLERLLARPTASLSIDSKEVQEFHEKVEGTIGTEVEKENNED